VLHSALVNSFLCGLCLVAALLGSACNPAPSGNRALPFNPAKLVSECEVIAKGADENGKFRDSLPPLVQSLKPQVVTVRTTEVPAATMVNIQVLGGFQHEGYIVVVTNRGPEFIPRAGSNWRVTKVAPQVFFYRE
jgi:hypothetical protein